MIPTLILFGLVCGRWWRAALVAAALGWPALLVVLGTLEPRPGQLLGAAALAVVNTAAGVLVHQAVRWVIVRGVGRRGDSMVNSTTHNR